jgi:hypothetical protein
MVHRLPPLRGSALARFKRDEANAEKQLGIEVGQFFADCESGAVVERLKRRPSASDLFSFFRSYAEVVFGAEARERLEAYHISSRRAITRYTSSLDKLVEIVVHRIGGQQGVWRRVVEQGCRHFALGDWPSPYGRYGFASFLHRHEHLDRIRAALQVSVRHWDALAWDRVAKTTDSGQREIDQERTALGRNIDQLRLECGWSVPELAKKTGLDKKLILGHINKGKGTFPRTVKVYADAFAKELKRPVSPADLMA